MLSRAAILVCLVLVAAACDTGVSDTTSTTPALTATLFTPQPDPLDRVIQVSFDGNECVVTGPRVVPVGNQPVVFTNASGYDARVRVSWRDAYADSGPGLMLDELQAMQREAGGILWEHPGWWGDDNELEDKHAYVLMLHEEDRVWWSDDPDWFALLEDREQWPERRLNVYALTDAPTMRLVYLLIEPNEAPPELDANIGFWFCDDFATSDTVDG